MKPKSQIKRIKKRYADEIALAKAQEVPALLLPLTPDGEKYPPYYLDTEVDEAYLQDILHRFSWPAALLLDLANRQERPVGRVK
jgi:hypothetical protein